VRGEVEESVKNKVWRNFLWWGGGLFIANEYLRTRENNRKGKHDDSLHRPLPKLQGGINAGLKAIHSIKKRGKGDHTGS